MSIFGLLEVPIMAVRREREWKRRIFQWIESLLIILVSNIVDLSWYLLSLSLLLSSCRRQQLYLKRKENKITIRTIWIIFCMMHFAKLPSLRFPLYNVELLLFKTACRLELMPLLLLFVLTGGFLAVADWAPKSEFFLILLLFLVIAAV